AAIPRRAAAGSPARAPARPSASGGRDPPPRAAPIRRAPFRTRGRTPRATRKRRRARASLRPGPSPDRGNRPSRGGSRGRESAGRAQRLLEPALGAEEKRPRRRFGRLEYLGGFAVRKSFDLAQKERRALARRKPPQLGLEREAQRMVRLSVRSERELRRQRRFGAARPAAGLVVAGVDQDSVDPGRRRGSSAESRSAAIDLQERFLNGVFGVGRAPEKVGRDRFHALPVCLKEPLEGRKTPP